MKAVNPESPFTEPDKTGNAVHVECFVLTKGLIQYHMTECQSQNQSFGNGGEGESKTG